MEFGIILLGWNCTLILLDYSQPIVFWAWASDCISDLITALFMNCLPIDLHCIGHSKIISVCTFVANGPSLCLHARHVVSLVSWCHLYLVVLSHRPILQPKGRQKLLIIGML